jgi:hypothetical protein
MYRGARDPRSGSFVVRWPEVRRERLAERAAIMEVDGGLGRDEAERQAFALLAEREG